MSLLNGISLITAFFGGMVALFAPCCITFLLPSYLANIFRERRRVVWMTIVFGAGIATILVPVALGVRAIGQFFQQFHTQTYIAGGIFMILLGAMELTGKKITIPMINLTIDLNRRHDTWSVYLLGVFSGITTSCCTPVLAGVLTLSFLSPTFLWAGLAGISYVFGMVVPLVVMALVLEKLKWQKLLSLRTKSVKIGSKTILASDALAGLLYILVGIIFSVLALTGRVTMGMETPLEATLGITYGVARTLRTVPYGEYFFAVVIIISLFFFIKKGGKKS